jgi:osmotically-inducible protein OsmY
MGKTLFAKTLFTAALSLAVCCWSWAPEARGQGRLNQDQPGFNSLSGGGQNSGAFGSSQQGSGQQGGSAFGQQQGQQFGQGQRTGAGQINPGQQRVVGNNADAVRRSFENMSGRQRRSMMMDSMVENLNQMRNDRREQESRRRSPDPIRIRLRPTFNYQLPSSQQIALELQAHLLRSEALTGIVAPRVEIVDRVATVSGFVPSEHERAVLAKMISMQPGVSKVNNELTIDPFAPTTEPESQAGPTESAESESVSE